LFDEAGEIEEPLDEEEPRAVPLVIKGFEVGRGRRSILPLVPSAEGDFGNTEVFAVGGVIVREGRWLPGDTFGGEESTGTEDGGSNAGEEARGGGITGVGIGVGSGVVGARGTWERSGVGV
jgi:hypothetical protein